MNLIELGSARVSRAQCRIFLALVLIHGVGMYSFCSTTLRLYDKRHWKTIKCGSRLYRIASYLFTTTIPETEVVWKVVRNRRLRKFINHYKIENGKESDEKKEKINLTFVTLLTMIV